MTFKRATLQVPRFKPQEDNLTMRRASCLLRILHSSLEEVAAAAILPTICKSQSMLVFQLAKNRAALVSSPGGRLRLTSLQPNGELLSQILPGEGLHGPSVPRGEVPVPAHISLCHLRALCLAGARWKQSAAQERDYSGLLLLARDPVLPACHQSNLSSAGGTSQEQ